MTNQPDSIWPWSTEALGRLERLLAASRSKDERIVALEAAARRLNDAATFWKDGTLVWCHSCSGDEATGGHAADCPVGMLAGLLEDA